MTLRLTGVALARRDLIRALVIVAAVIIAVAALGGAFGLHEMGPTYQVTVDPAGPLGF